MDLKFEWDEEKRQINLAKHEIDFMDAIGIWDGEVLEFSSPQTQHGEKRWLAVGVLEGRLVTVIYTWRWKTRRIISARIARKDEKENYAREIE